MIFRIRRNQPEIIQETEMKCVSLSTTLAVGACALALATGPSFGLGSSLAGGIDQPPAASGTPPPPSSTGVGGIDQPPAVDDTIAPPPTSPEIGGLDQPVGNPFAELIPAEYSPKLLDMGIVREYRHQQGKATLTITAPAYGKVWAAAWPLKGRFHVTAMTVWAPKGLGLEGGQPRVLQSGDGQGALDARPGDVITVDVAFDPAANSPPMLTGELRAGSDRWQVRVPIRVFVLHEPEIAAEARAEELKIVQGQDAEVVVRLNRRVTASFTSPSGFNQNVTIAPATLPPGVSMDPVTVSVPAEAAYVDAAVRFHASDAAPLGAGLPTSLRVLGVGGAGEQQIVELSGHVYPPATSWAFHDRTGDVEYEGTLTIRSDGTWRCQVHLHDHGKIYGDSFLLGLGVRLFETVYETPPYGHEAEPQQRLVIPIPAVVSGALGGGVFGGSRDADYDPSDRNSHYQKGPIPALRAHYCQAVDAGYFYQMRGSSEERGVGKEGPSMGN
jgi:hypothetical protein